jgi:fermentation-respiration switch protein FrsA (DUF1100 family)
VRTIAAVLGMVVIAAIAVVVTMWLLQRRFIYFPDAAPPPPPAQMGLPAAEPLEFTTGDGLRLQAWYVPAAGEQVGAVLVLPGNGGNRAGRWPLAAALRRAGLATLLVDYRGYGGNPGEPTQEGLLADARAAADALERRSGVGRERLVYFGESLGAAVAAGLAAERQPGALVLRSPFPSLTEMGRRQFPWLPVGLLLRDRFPTAEWVARYRGPVLVIAGAADALVPPHLSRRVADAAVGPVTVETVGGAGHNDRLLLDGEQMITALLGFLDERTAIAVRR